MVHHNNYAADRLVREFGIDVANQMVNVQARVLPPPMVGILQDSHFVVLSPVFLLIPTVSVVLAEIP